VEIEQDNHQVTIGRNHVNWVTSVYCASDY